MNETKTMYHAVPVVSELNRVKGFDPTRFLRKTKDGPKLDLNVKKLWFRLKYPNGRIKLSALKITDQLAIIEARVFFDKNDTQPVSSFTAQTNNQTTPGGLYIEMAQHNAIDEALSSAGFGIQFVPANESRRPIVSESEIPSKVDEKPIVKTETVKVETPIEKKVEPEPVVEPVIEETVEEPVIEAIVEEPITEVPTAPIAEMVESAPVEEAPAPVETKPEPEVVAPVNEVTEIQEDENNLSYNKSMSVEEICALMTEEEARNYVVPVGTCKNWTMDQVASRRPVSLKYYLSPAYTGDDNILRAAATIMLRLTQSQAA